MLAAHHGRKGVVQVLLEKKANPNITDKVGFCVHVRITYHCSLCVQTASRSALIFAAEGGNIEITKLLVGGGADVDLKDKVDW
jgi:ankyrin repeat protein